MIFFAPMTLHKPARVADTLVHSGNVVRSPPYITGVVVTPRLGMASRDVPRRSANEVTA